MKIAPPRMSRALGLGRIRRRKGNDPRVMGICWLLDEVFPNALYG